MTDLNNTSKNKIELLAPAGDLEKLKIAAAYGADAVYFGGEAFSLRAGSANLKSEDMRPAMDYLHERGKKGYLAFNIYPHNEDIPQMKEYLKRIADIPIDGFIVSDPGTMDLLREYIPDAEIHLSTQANMTNYLTAGFWYRQGVKRVVTAREMSIAEIKELRANMPSDMEIESFVHGAMCISYSGRCLLSNVMTGRDANRGMCAHPCRWKYHIVEEKRPGVYYPVEEDDRGTYIMNSKDLCMIDHVPDLIEAGVTSFKIEGRIKSIFYLATVIAQYRRAIDAALSGRPYDPAWLTELSKVSNRGFTTGFYYGKPTAEDQNYITSDYQRDYSFIGVVRDYDPLSGIATVEQRNKMNVGDEIEIFGPDMPFFSQRLEEMTDEEGNALASAPHAQQILKIKVDKPVKPDYILRKQKPENE